MAINFIFCRSPIKVVLCVEQGCLEMKHNSLFKRKRDCSGRLQLGRLPMFVDLRGNLFYAICVHNSCNGVFISLGIYGI